VRLFAAVDVDDDTRAAIGEVRRHLQAALLAAPAPPRVTWVREDAAHVTLRFIGEVGPETAVAIRAALAAPIRVPPFELQWDRLGRFPGGRAPRVIWVGASRGADQLARLARMVGERLDPIVGADEPRPFTAHVTIGRIKDPGRGFDWRAALAAVTLAPTITHTDHVTLYRSHLSPKGPSYEVVVKTLLE
jgi:RNA 2',3'-cyclic 3'-phosphodiesterase